MGDLEKSLDDLHNHPLHILDREQFNIIHNLIQSFYSDKILLFMFINILQPTVKPGIPAILFNPVNIYYLTVLCPKQTYSADNEVYCTVCPAGQYQPQPGSSSCIPCTSPVEDAMCLRMLVSKY